MKKSAAPAKQDNRKTTRSLKEKSEGKTKRVGKTKSGAASPAGAKERVAGIGEPIQERLHEVVDTAVAGVERRVDFYVQRASDRIREIEKTGHEAARKLSPQQPEALTDTIEYLAGQIGGLADYFERREARDILDDTRRLIREHPVPTLGAFALLGITAGRVLLAERDAPTR
ncbi:MAG: hypothetical protein GXX91_03165 [Verrucomicrobiaceae bacterium]|nr:hypothetical protein [Verrucomicrobiaceae bacterium]